MLPPISQLVLQMPTVVCLEPEVSIVIHYSECRIRIPFAYWRNHSINVVGSRKRTGRLNQRDNAMTFFRKILPLLQCVYHCSFRSHIIARQIGGAVNSVCTEMLSFLSDVRVIC